MYDIVFYLLAALTIGAALAVVTLRNIVHSAFFLALLFVGVAGIYVLLQADYLAAVQIMVYVGAIAILIAFGVMLTRRGNINESNLFNKQAGVSALVVAATLGVIVWLVSSTNWVVNPGQVPDETVKIIATTMLTDYVVAFEGIAILLLVAIVGAILIAKEVKNSK
ncbi:MAG: NADH-quinone oxidoreductase subunit J family protein [Thermincolia bacterium]